MPNQRSTLSHSLHALVGLALCVSACAGSETPPVAHGIRPGDLVDIDGDGVYDGIAVDSDGDGDADGVDTDADGIADQPLPGGPPLPDAGRPEPECPETNPFCDDDPDNDERPELPPGCGEEEFDLSPVGVNVMVSMDASNSMNAFWTQTQEAIRDMILTNPRSNYGMHLFWGEPVEDFFQGVSAGFNFCGRTANDVLDTAPDQQTLVLPFMGPQARGQGNDFFDFTPVIDPLNYYLENTTNLEDPRSTNYLVFISDGNDNCFGTAFASANDKLLAYEKLAIELVKKNIRVLPIGFDASSNQMTGGGGMRMTNFEALDTLARFGGTGLEHALAADDPAELAEALQTVAQTVVPCRFSIPATLDPTQNLNPFELSFFLNGMLVPRDRTRVQGWNFIDGNTSEVEFYGQSCEAIRFGTKLQARRSCESEVCGTSATKVSTKGRAVQYLLDSSLTMGDCSYQEDASACWPKRFCDITGLCAMGGGQLSWWGAMTKAIGTSVVDVVNDDVEFGLRMFPSAGLPVTEACTVSEQPEVEPGQGTELTIIRWLLSDLPYGFTPIVDGLERVAANPGRLAADEVLGALIVVSDGGDTDSCGVTPEDAVVRAGQAAKTLFDMGVKTYVIRFGTRDENTAADDLILRAIVENGGTAMVDPNDPSKPPYPNAPDEATLNAVLATISDELASCGLTLGELDDTADKDKVNLYLNGEVVPFDLNGEKANGWGWTDAERTQIELYGESCTAFKNNRVTSLVVEFGCDIVIL